jgi:endonuclease/exonuclease/phosphatase family metal-dependent hydrolase
VKKTNDSSLLKKILVVVGLGIAAMLWLRCDSGGSGCLFRRSIRIGTYNIRRFGKESTDMKRLTAIVRDADPDVLGLQEVMDVERVRDLATRLSGRSQRYEFVLTKCKGKSEMHVGYLFDTRRVQLVSTKEYPELDPNGGDRCGEERSGLGAKFSRTQPNEDSSFQLLVLHMIAGGEKGKQEKRREQWKRAHRIAAAMAKENSAPVAILGDTNSTGFLDDRYGERTFILDEAKKAGLEVPTSGLACTEYFQPENKPLTPSLLDHFVASPGLVRPSSVKVHGFCAKLSCKPTESAPEDYTTVSDHCPVTLDLN